MEVTFENYEPSTKTFVVNTNLAVNIEDIFYKKILPITPYVVVKKKRGRKKKVMEEDPNKDLKCGSIIRVQYRKEVQGVTLKDKGKKKGFFRNSITIVIFIGEKLINFKLSNNGKFQVTGCKTEDQAEKCVLYIWKYIKAHKDVYEFSEGVNLRAIYDPVMHNIDFSLGFNVNRENLDNYINSYTPYTSLLEPTLGYTGVNIKMPVDVSYSKLKLQVKEYNGKGVVSSFITFQDYLTRYKKKDLKKVIYNTFLVFQSGKVIMSGKVGLFMSPGYDDFVKVLKKCDKLIREDIAGSDSF
jgi:TATA-box binding protein (TBP) (component of TFIID and TFIIIB)